MLLQGIGVGFQPGTGDTGLAGQVAGMAPGMTAQGV